ncbi:uncharacterized protein I206_106370 [Kwoniella pini CBS 10737]|uniref:Cation efflux protein transmembrane domain-containing protein n=1 Tax=Kwoniella pini CBS 10737 TaxID=1296096 RepID=A0AAJ8LAI7_9TREE
MPTLPSPASTSSTETSIPTPDQSYSSRRSSVVSPYLYSFSMSEDQEAGDVFSPTSSGPLLSLNGEDTPKGNGKATVAPVSINHGLLPNGIASPTPFSRRRSNTGNRAPAPPPIFLRRATGVENADQDEIVPVPGSASTTSSMPDSAKGLNISGMMIPSLSSPTEIEQENSHGGEEGDALPELMASPRPRLNFNMAEGAPASPAWQSIEATPSLTGLNASTSWGRRTSLEVPSPLGPRNNERRFDPTPQHGIHARNLSLFFPQPGNPIPPRPDGSPALMESPVQLNDSMIPSVGGDRNVFGGTGNWSFGQASASQDENGMQTPDVKRSKRRGHHHKHSLSHNFFSFLDPTQTNPSLAASPSPKPPSTPGPEATPAPVPMPSLGVSALSATSPTLSPLPPSKSDPRKQFYLSFAVLEFLIGAALWVEGQMSGWRCLAGVGYLVVFDAIGIAVEMVARNEGSGYNTIRRPYGPSRYMSLLYFTQSLFLVFAAVYIAKEAIEQVILGAGAHDHSGGGHGHGESAIEGDERDFPHFLLACAAIASTFAGGALGNHGKLVDAVGTLFLTSNYLSMPIVSQFAPLLANPFTLTIAGSSAGIVVSSLLVHPSALHSLDSFISLILTILTCALSYPPTIAFAHVLLQTAPSASQTQMLSLRKALKEIKEDRRVIGLGTMRVWAITAGKGSFEDRYPPTPSHSQTNSLTSSPNFDSGKFFSPPTTPSRKQSFDVPNHMNYPSPYGNLSTKQIGDDGAPLVVTLTVHVHPDSSDKDILNITKFSYLKIENAISSNPGGLGIAKRDGEVSIAIKRGWEGLEDG